AGVRQRYHAQAGKEIVQPRPPEPDLERGNRLVDEHVDAVDCAEPALARPAQELRVAAGKAVDEIDHRSPWRELRRIERYRVVGESHRGALDHDRGFLQSAPRRLRPELIRL